MLHGELFSSILLRIWKFKNQTKNSLYHFGKIYVYPTGTLSQTLCTAAEPAAQHSGAQEMDRRSLEYDSKTIKTPCFPVFSEPTQTQVSSQVKTARPRDPTPVHRQEIDVLSTGSSPQGYRGQFVSFIRKRKAESFKNPYGTKDLLTPLIFVELCILFSMIILLNQLGTLVWRSFFSSWLIYFPKPRQIKVSFSISIAKYVFLCHIDITGIHYLHLIIYNFSMRECKAHFMDTCCFFPDSILLVLFYSFMA